MKTRNKVMIAAVAVLFVVVIVLLVWGISTHTEPGLLEGVPQWERSTFPLDVAAATYRADDVQGLTEDHRDALDHVLDLVNGRLGFTAYRWAEDPDAAEVVVTIGVPHDSTWRDPGGDAVLIPDGGHLVRCNVRTSNTGTQELLVLTLHHELGHCLGLAHDDFGISIMRRTQEPTPDRQIPPWITDYDRGLLRDLYGPR